MPDATRPAIQLQPHQTEQGRGYVVADAAGGSYPWERLPDGLLSFLIDRDERNAETLDMPDFSPLSRVALVPDTENRRDPGVVGVWNTARTHQLGYVPRPEFRVRDRVARDVDFECLVAWEAREDGVRTGVRLLVVDRDLRIGVVRGPGTAPVLEPVGAAAVTRSPRGAMAAAIAVLLLVAGLGIALGSC